MPITRSYTNNFEVVDFTQELQIVPNTWTLLGEMGIFTEEFLTTRVATFEEQNQSLALVTDTVWGGAPIANTDDTRKIRSYPVATFKIADAVRPGDIQGVRAYGSQDMAETEAAVLARKIAKIRKRMDITLETARFKTITTGNLYSPSGAIAGNLFSDFGISQKSVNFALGTGTTDIVAKVEEVIAYIQDNAFTGDVINGVVGLCSSEFFSAFIAHAKVQQAYLYYSSTANQEILRNRAGGAGLYREFQFGGLRLVEVRQTLGGVRAIPANEAVFLPMGLDDTFVTYYSPADRLGYENTIAERGYVFTYRNPKGTSIDIDSESNFMNVVRRPALMVKGTVS